MFELRCGELCVSGALWGRQSSSGARVCLGRAAQWDRRCLSGAEVGGVRSLSPYTLNNKH